MGDDDPGEAMTSKDEATELDAEIGGDTPNVGLIGRLFQVILGLSAFFLFFLGIHVQSACFNGNCGTFAESLPCYTISFILLVLMSGVGLGSQGSSDSQKEKLGIAWFFGIEAANWPQFFGIEAANWKKFKTRIVILVVIFSLVLAPLWYFDYSRGNRSLDYGEDCNDEVVGPDVDLVDADFSNMKLRGCDLSNRDLTGAVFSETNLACADFSNSILKGAHFDSPDFRGTIFDNADLSDANFQGQTRWGDSTYGSNYDEIIRVDCDYDISFKGANLTNADFETLFVSSRIGPFELVFDNAIMDNTNFVVQAARYSWISFDNAIMDNANLVVEYLDLNYDASVSMVNVSFIGTDISMTLPPGSDLSQSNMSEANFIDFMALDLASCPLSLPETYNCAEIGDKKMIFGPSMDFSDKWISFWDNEAKGSDLSGANFSGLYIPNSIFQAVRLNDSKMSDSNLSNSNFTYNHKIYDEQYLEYDACIDEGGNCSIYAEAALEEWGIDNFSGLKYHWSTNLTNVDFTGSNLSYSDFSYSNIVGANLKDADLTGAIWYYTICPDGTNSGKTGSCSAT